MIGRTVSHYEITDLLGSGGMGVVFRARDSRLERAVALKFLPPGLTRETAAKARFVREARAASSLDHPNICTVHEVDETPEGQMFIVMTYYAGETLRERLREGPLRWRLAADLAVQIARGLEIAHQHGIVHRDIKPGNIMITPEGRAVVMDFGLALVVDASGCASASSRTGTPCYMSPEQLRGEPVDARTDIWSLGVVLYEMLTGQPPFHADYQQAMDFRILHDDPPSLTAEADDVPAPLADLVANCLAKAPAERPASSREFRERLQALLVEDARGARASVEPGPSSIAVLPFVNMSADPEQEYFCDGMAEEIINSLTKLGTLRVVARTSAFSFKGRTQDIRQIGRTLGVAMVLEGSVRKWGDRLRVTAQLIGVEDGYHIWSERYDRQLQDVFAVQDEIAQAIAEMVAGPQPAGAPVLPSAARVMPDTEAYNLYLKGRYFWRGRTQQKLRRSLEIFEQSAARDPAFAAAQAGIADAYNLLGCYGCVRPADAFPRARAAAESALRLDSESAEALTSRGFVRMFYDWEMRGAEADFLRALELNPGYSTAHHWYGEYHIMTGDLDRALEYGRSALACDPVNPILNAYLGWVSYARRDYGSAIMECQKALELDPGAAWALLFLGFARIRLGEWRGAAEAFADARANFGDSGLFRAAEGLALATGGRLEDARIVLAELENADRYPYVSPCFLAAVHLALGQHERALDSLAAALAVRDFWLIFLKTDPVYDELRHLPRFQALVSDLTDRTQGRA